MKFSGYTILFVNEMRINCMLFDYYGTRNSDGILG